jgi:hypothetical protein
VGEGAAKRARGRSETGRGTLAGDAAAADGWAQRWQVGRGVSETGETGDVRGVRAGYCASARWAGGAALLAGPAQPGRGGSGRCGLGWPSGKREMGWAAGQAGCWVLGCGFGFVFYFPFCFLFTLSIQNLIQTKFEFKFEFESKPHSNKIMHQHECNKKCKPMINFN